jgi:hypothetical protein
MTTETAFADLEIRILGGEAEGYPVELTVNQEQQYARGYLQTGFLPWIPGVSPAEDGERLFRWLFADDRLKTAWAEVRGGQPHRRLRLRIDAAAPELHAIPWELLRDPGDGGVSLDLAASAATPFSRYLAGRWQPGSPVLTRPIKILVAVANPTNLTTDYNLPAIDVEQEGALLKAATDGLEVALTLLPQPCTLAALEAALRNGYHVLHFVGHGSYSDRAGKAVLYMADAANQVALVSDAEFAAMLARQLADTGVGTDDKLRLVFLASCQTATRSPADAFRGFAPGLVAAGVPAVVAMQDLVPLRTAQEFARVFYRQLLGHGQVDLAANEARSTLMSAQLPGAAIPVLFNRLRSGELLGQRGRITSDREEMFWPFLLDNVDQGLCTAFLGPRVTEGLLPTAETVAEKLADRYGYPLADRHDLVHVAQFMAINDPEVLRNDYLRLLQRSLFSFLGVKPTEEQKRALRDAGLSQTTEALNWAETVLDVQENELHHLLADLPLPLYLTTNADSFMFEALRQRGRSPRRIGPRWEQPEAGSPQWVLTPAPSRDQPVVFHLNGYDGDEEQRKHLVLSEDDYLSHFVRLSRDHETFLPMNLLRMLSEHSFLFLGYQLDDWEFRSVLQGLIRPVAQTNRGKKVHVGVQLDVDQVADVDRARKYLARYLDQFNIDVYWGTPRQFVSELHSRWQAYSQAVSDDWGR